MIRHYFSAILFLFFSYSNIALSQLPETAIYLLDIKKTNAGYQFLNPTLITKKNGYNNQPYFTPDGKSILYVSNIDSINTEIYTYNLKKKKSKRLTHTPEPEYSPRYTLENNAISCVRVEKDKTTQHFYTYNLKGKKPKLQLPTLNTIGYYSWKTPIEFYCAVVPDPMTLMLFNTISGKGETLRNNIGRCIFYYREKNKFCYVDKSDSTNWFIRTLNNDYRKPKGERLLQEDAILTTTLPNEEDFCFMQDGSILMAHEGKIYLKKNPFRNVNATWEQITDLIPYGLTSFYRMVLSPNYQQIAIVAFKGKKP